MYSTDPIGFKAFSVASGGLRIRHKATVGAASQTLAGTSLLAGLSAAAVSKQSISSDVPVVAVHAISDVRRLNTLLSRLVWVRAQQRYEVRCVQLVLGDVRMHGPRPS